MSWLIRIVLGISMLLYAKWKHSNSSYPSHFGVHWVVGALLLPPWVTIVAWGVAQAIWWPVPKSPDCEEPSLSDQVFYLIQSVGSPTLCLGMVACPGKVNSEMLLDAIQVRIVEKVKRFRQILRHCGQSLYYQDVSKTMNLYEHVTFEKLKSGSRRELEDHLSSLLGRELCETKPLWEIHVFENVELKECELSENNETGFAVVLCFHHTIADGVGFLSVLNALLDEKPDVCKTTAAVKMTNTTAKQGIWEIKNIGKIIYSLIRQELLLPDAMGGRFKKRLNSGRKEANWHQLASVQELKIIGSKLQGSFNSVLLACWAGAVRQSYPPGEAIPDYLRIGFGANTRSPTTESIAMGNYIGTVFVALPIKETDIRTRIKLISKELERAKNELEFAGSELFNSAASCVPYGVFQMDLAWKAYKMSFVFGSVAGPLELGYLLGSPVTAFMGYPPHIGPYCGIGVSIVTFAGKVWFGLCLDKAAAEDINSLTDLFCSEFNALKSEVVA